MQEVQQHRTSAETAAWNADHPGLLAFLSSGETTPAGKRVHEWLFQRLHDPIRAAVVGTPCGFELNAYQVIQRIADFLQTHLQNYHPEIRLVPAFKRGSYDGPDSPAALEPVMDSNYIFMGPGSPTYTARHLSGTRLWYAMMARQRMGASLCLASAAATAAGAFALPVYEIHKAGEDLHWHPGLNLLGPYGLRLAVITHWNNLDGGANLDTSRCFMGQERMARLIAMLPADTTVVGIDERTALIVDLGAGSCQVLGDGAVALIKAKSERIYPADSTFPLEHLGKVRSIAPALGIPQRVWQETLLKAQTQPDNRVPENVAQLIVQREAARLVRDWTSADAIREQLAVAGYQLIDTPSGTQCIWTPRRAEAA